MAPKGPYKLVTVNKVPARAKILIGRVAEDVKENYTIDYVENAERMEDVKGMVERNQPDVLENTAFSTSSHCSFYFPGPSPDEYHQLTIPVQFVASMWTAEEANEIQSIAKSTKPGIKTMAIPHGLQVEKGPDAVVEFLKEQWPGLVEN
ncbi:alpha beta fold family hydrolase protein [Rutstroemia sp. NJR-2017a BBW]|nr:alpha beta fold family hydrolase protein [Rutstroemia sp. NJR-2017a BBW]